MGHVQGMWRNEPRGEGKRRSAEEWRKRRRTTKPQGSPDGPSCRCSGDHHPDRQQDTSYRNQTSGGREDHFRRRILGSSV